MSAVCFSLSVLSWRCSDRHMPRKRQLPETGTRQSKRIREKQQCGHCHKWLCAQSYAEHKRAFYLGIDKRGKEQWEQDEDQEDDGGLIPPDVQQAVVEHAWQEANQNPAVAASNAVDKSVQDEQFLLLQELAADADAVSAGS